MHQQHTRPRSDRSDHVATCEPKPNERRDQGWNPFPTESEFRVCCNEKPPPKDPRPFRALADKKGKRKKERISTQTSSLPSSPSLPSLPSYGRHFQAELDHLPTVRGEFQGGLNRENVTAAESLDTKIKVHSQSQTVFFIRDDLQFASSFLYPGPLHYLDLQLSAANFEPEPAMISCTKPGSWKKSQLPGLVAAQCPCATTDPRSPVPRVKVPQLVAVLSGKI